jgi:branched-chain amino acid transport system permease protein
MDILFQLIAESLLLGAFYAFMSLGFSLVWGVLGILNLAYGSLIVTGAYLSYLLFTHTGADPILSVPLTFLQVDEMGYEYVKTEGHYQYHKGFP